MESRKNIEERRGDGPRTLWNIDFIMVLVFGFISGTANQMVSPLLSKYAVSLGASLALAGFIVGLQSGTAMFLRPVSGASSDLLNRKHIMIGSGAVTSLAYAGYLIFSSITSVIICRVLQGIAFAFMSVARTAYATEFIPKNRMGEGVAFTSFGVVLSQAVGPAVGLWISENWGYNACFAIALFCSILGATLLAIRPYKHRRGAFNWNRIKLSNLIAFEVVPYALISGLFAMIIQLGNSFLALIGDERGIANVGIFFTIYSVSALVLRPLSGRALDRFGLSVLIYPAFIFAALTMVLIGSASSLLFIIIAGFTKALSQGVALPSIQGSAIKRLGMERAGVASATIHLGTDLMMTLAPAFGGVLATKLGYRDMFYIYAVVVLFGMPAFAMITRRDKKRGVDYTQ